LLKSLKMSSRLRCKASHRRDPISKFSSKIKWYDLSTSSR